ncbi:hypothetical protein DdX_05231 [Ditylenchus destructor]|uniref:Uncharacterized protein n=1 Tax=Ditylenchus destructor TaxID=166010 RepID=A0AAD4NCI1_9BILA|nr:hypothetical protein DdX_05231 [Ditylenchus destructor]
MRLFAFVWLLFAYSTSSQLADDAASVKKIPRFRMPADATTKLSFKMHASFIGGNVLAFTIVRPPSELCFSEDRIRKTLLTYGSANESVCHISLEWRRDTFFIGKYGASINRGNISVTIKNDKIRLDYISMFGTRIVSRYKNEVCAAPEANSFKDDHEEYWIWELSLENVQEVGKTVKQKKCYVDVIFSEAFKLAPTSDELKRNCKGTWMWFFGCVEVNWKKWLIIVGLILLVLILIAGCGACIFFVVKMWLMKRMIGGFTDLFKKDAKDETTGQTQRGNSRDRTGAIVVEREKA